MATSPGQGPTTAPVGGNTAQQAQTQQLVSTLVTVTRAMSSFNTDLTRFVNQIKSSSKQAEDTLKQRTTIDKKDVVLKSKLLKEEADAVAQQRKLQNEQQRLNDKQRALDAYQVSLKSKYVDEIKKDLEFQRNKLKQQERQLLESVKRIKNLRDELEKASSPALRRRLEDDLTKQLKTHKNLGKELSATTDKVTALSGAQGKQTMVAKLLSGSFRGLLSKTESLISGFSAATAAAAAWGSTVAQSSTRETDTLGGMVKNWFGQITSGVSQQLYDSILAQTRNVKLAGGEEAQRKVITTGRDEFFKYTGSFDKAAEATASIVPGLQAAGIGSKDLSGTISNLVPQFAKLSQATGESVTEIAKMSAGMMLENDTRSMLRGTLKQDRDQVLQRMLVRQQELALAGYSLEQTKEIQREEIRRKMGGTIRERAKDFAQMFAASEMAIRMQQDPEKRAKMQGELDIMKQNRSAALSGVGKEAVDAQARLHESNTRLMAMIHEQNSVIQANTGFLHPLRVWQESIAKQLTGNQFGGAAYQAPMKEPTPKHQGDLTATSPLDSGVGEVAKGFQYVKAAFTNPLIIAMAALATTLGVTTVALGMFTKAVASIKVIRGGLDDLIPDVDRDSKGKPGKPKKPRRGDLTGGNSTTSAPETPKTTAREKLMERSKTALSAGADTLKKGAGIVAEKGKAALDIGKDVAKNIPWKQVASAGSAASIPAAAVRLLGANIVDPLAGMLGLGKDAAGKDLKVDNEQDDKNWERFSLLEKTQSGFLRSLESVTGFIGLDNLAREAEVARIQKETAYLTDLQTKNAASATPPQPNRFAEQTTALPTQTTQRVLGQLTPTISTPVVQLPQIVSAVPQLSNSLVPSIADTRLPQFIKPVEGSPPRRDSKSLEELGVVADIRTIVTLLGKLNTTLEADAEMRRELDEQIQFMLRKAGVEDRRLSRTYDQSRRHMGG